MSTWGVGLYQDDVACDIKEEYLNRLRIGMSNEEATSDLIDCCSDYINDVADGPLFWMVLAETQWKYGRLLPDVKKEALDVLRSGVDLVRFEEDEKLYKKRKRILEELEETLNSPLPTERKISKLVLHKRVWNTGDLLIYRVRSNELKDNKYFDKYLLFKVVGFCRLNIGSLSQEYSHEYDVVKLYNWCCEEEPNDLSFVKRLEFVNDLNDSRDGIYILDGNKRKLEKLGFKVISKENNCDEDFEISLNGISFAHEKNMDYGFVWDLYRANKSK